MAINTLLPTAEGNAMTIRRDPIAIARAAAALLLLAAAAAAGTYYVSPAGSDQAAGTAPGTAWKTLQHAADEVAAGDTVIVLPGTYAGFNLFTSGASGAPITFTANPGGFDPNPAVVVNTNNGFTGKDRINLEGASYVVIEGFTVPGTGDPDTNRTGIRTVGFPDDPARFVTLRANRCDQNGRWGILTGHVDDLLIEDNECSRATSDNGAGCRSRIATIVSMRVAPLNGSRAASIS